MSMKNYNSTGYLLKAREITLLLPAEVRAVYQDAVDNGDWEGAQGIAQPNWPKHFPPIECIFTLDDEAEFEEEDLEKGEMYVQFDESDLYEKKPTVALSNLMVEGVRPVYRRWVDFA
jgi:hypothetical protein